MVHSIAVTMYVYLQVFTSDHALKLDWIPKWIAIIGSGYIGLEFSDVYTALGSEVTFIEVPHMLDGLHPQFTQIASTIYPNCLRSSHTLLDLKLLHQSGSECACSDAEPLHAPIQRFPANLLV